MRTVLPVSARTAILVAVLLGVAACGATDGSPSPTIAFVSPRPPASTPATDPVASGLATATTLPGAGDDRPDLASVRVTLQPVATGLSSPIVVTGAGDGSGRLFVAQQGGQVRIVEQDGTLLPTPFIDLSDRIQSGGERGLLGLAFPPGFGTGRSDLYVHDSDRNGDTTIARYTVNAADPDTADPASERIILTQAQPYANHNGGWIGFDAHGLLLIGLGDGGSGGDPENRASNLGTILGKVLRIDVLGATGDEPYRIPADNPFVGQDGARGEILHLGLRNPFRASVDPATGNLWIGDVGQNAWEEVDLAPAGARALDFGWRRWEGRHCYDPSPGCDPAGVTMPVTEYPHADGCSVIGGVVYRGDAIPALRGAYLFSDYCSGRLWAIDAGMGSAQSPIVLVETGRAISSIGTNDAGEVFLTDIGGGEVLQLVEGG